MAREQPERAQRDVKPSFVEEYFALKFEKEKQLLQTRISLHEQYEQLFMVPMCAKKLFFFLRGAQAAHY